MDFVDMMDRSANGIQKSSASPHKVFFVSDGFNCIKLLPVMKDLGPVIEEHGGNDCFAFFFLLLGQH